MPDHAYQNLPSNHQRHSWPRPRSMLNTGAVFMAGLLIFAAGVYFGRDQTKVYVQLAAARAEVSSAENATNPIESSGGVTIGQVIGFEIDQGMELLDAKLKDIELKIAQLKAGSTAVLPAGTITMWHGHVDKLPAGWVLCDGSHGSPDLRGKFVRACESRGVNKCDIGATGGAAHQLTGGAGDHNHGGSAQPHRLTVAEMPRHTHPYEVGDAVRGHRYRTTGGEFYYGHHTRHTEATGGNHAHAHEILTEGNHTHSVDVTPPYYSLAFIMFTG